MEIWGRDNLATHNAYHMGKVCYTEDNITVYNLYVSNIPSFVNENHIKSYFSRFGEVDSVKIVQRRKIRSPFRYAFVNFKNPESAADALKVTPHLINGTRVRVKAADSWKQPIKQDYTKDDNTNNDIDNEISPNSILNLNDDCLLHIFSFLPLNDKLKMSSACYRFQNIFEMIFKIEKQLDLNTIGYLTLMEMRQIVTKVGHLIERISFNGEYLPNNQKRFIEFLPNFCRNLKELELQSVNNAHLDTFRRIANNLKSIKKLKLTNCDITDQTTLYLSQLPNIEILNLAENYELTGKYLNKFNKLKCLTLNNCPNIQPLYFSEMCKTLKSLIELNIKNCDLLNEESFNLMSITLIDLQNLTISTNYQAEKLCAIANLKNLKNLIIYCTSLRNDLFINLANRTDTEHTIEKLHIFGSDLNNKQKESIISIKTIKDLRLPRDPELDDNFLIECIKLKSLQYLDISGCTKITKYGVLTLLKLSENLRTLDLTLCYQFNIDFIYEAINILKKKKLNEQFKMMVSRTGIHQSIEEDQKYIENKDIIKLSFEFNLSNIELYDEDDDEDDLYSYDPDFISDDDDDDEDDRNLFGFYGRNHYHLDNESSEYETDDDYDFGFDGFEEVLAFFVKH